MTDETTAPTDTAIIPAAETAPATETTPPNSAAETSGDAAVVDAAPATPAPSEHEAVFKALLDKFEGDAVMALNWLKAEVAKL